MRYLGVIFLLILVGCGAIDPKTQPTYFSGTIVNPTSNYVTLHREEALIDTAYLDQYGRFSMRLEGLEEGLYHFDHPPEYNYVYLQKGDSIHIRINTVSFDESLVFSGRGSELNNFILEMFLTNERESYSIEKNYVLDPEPFHQLIETIRNDKLSMLNDLQREVTLSERAVSMVAANIDYNLYVHKEKYPFFHENSPQVKDFPAAFFDYRKNIERNNRDLSHFKPYFQFMKFHLGNMAYEECTDQCGIIPIPEKPLHFNLHKLTIIDSLVEDRLLKDQLMRQLALQYWVKSQDTEARITQFYQVFVPYLKENRYAEELNEVYQSIISLQPDRDVLPLPIVDHQGKLTNLRKLTEDRKVVIYFWSTKYEGMLYRIQQKVAELQKKWPEYQFIGISPDQDATHWSATIQEYDMQPELQYRSINPEDLQNRLIWDNAFKSVVLENGKIVNGFANLQTSFQNK
ncbi:MAG: TlpA family protein disulfide reductase [Flavobacteriaceae bacterium]